MPEKELIDEVAKIMLHYISDAQGRKKLKPGDLIKISIEFFGDRVDKKICKDAIRQLIDSGKCVYTYFGGSYIEIPHEEGAANKL